MTDTDTGVVDTGGGEPPADTAPAKPTGWRGIVRDPAYVVFLRELRDAKRRVMTMEDATPDERAMVIFNAINNSKAKYKYGRKVQLSMLNMAGGWPVVVGKEIDLRGTTMMPSVLDRTMALLNISMLDMSLIYGCSREIVKKWINGYDLVPPIVAAYIMLRGNEVVRSYANGFGFGVMTDVDVAAVSGISQEAAAALALNDEAKQEKIMLRRHSRTRRMTSRANIRKRKSKDQNGLPV